MLANPPPPGTTPWQLTRASVRGKAHVDTGVPNQDCVEMRASPDGRIVAGVISDGAGTASHAELGSRTTCQVMASWMLGIGQAMAAEPHDDARIEQKVAAGIERVRATMLASGAALRDQHCTFVACVLTDRTGFVCQVGDSIAISTRFEQAAGQERGKIDFFPDRSTEIFQVDRGDYVNETHFITEPDWRSHLRVRSFETPAIDAMLIMSDGAMEIATTGGKVFRGFLSNLVALLLTLDDANERDATLDGWLADRRTFPTTGDDKTMLIAIRGACMALAGLPVHVGDSGLTAPQRPRPPTGSVPHKATPPDPTEAAPTGVVDEPASDAGRGDAEADDGRVLAADLRTALASGVATVMFVIAGACFIYREPISSTIDTTMECIVGPPAHRGTRGAAGNGVEQASDKGAATNPGTPPPPSQHTNDAGPPRGETKS